MSVQPRVTASVVSHGQGELLQALLGDLAQLKPSSIARLVVTLNVDEPEPAIGDLGGAQVLVIRNPRPLGFGANHNQAFRQCETEWFAVLNPDLRMPQDPFPALLDAAAQGDGMLAPTCLEDEGGEADSLRRLLTPWQLLLRTLGRSQPVAPGEAEWFAGMFLLVRSAAFRQVGGFDARFYMYCEDADLSVRLQLAGWHLRAIKRVAVRHAAQRSSHSSARHLRWHLSSLLKHWMSAAYWRYLRHRQTLRSPARGPSGRIDRMN